jgi:gentisate 1,2-dioxygenase
VVAGEGRSTIGEQRFEWSRHDVFTIPHWSWASHEARSASADLLIVTDRSIYERLDLLREEIL